MIDNEKLLQEYSREIGVYNALTWEKLIDSHRHIRAKAREYHDDYRAQMNKGFEAGKQYYAEVALKEDWFTRERLKSMTIGELANLLADYE